MYPNLFSASRKYVYQFLASIQMKFETSSRRCITTSLACKPRAEHNTGNDNFNRKITSKFYQRAIRDGPSLLLPMQISKRLFPFDIDDKKTKHESEISVEKPRDHAVVSQSYTEEKGFEDVPGPRGVYSWPLIGTLLHFKPFTRYTLRNIHELYMDLFEQHGPLVRLRFGQWVLLVEDPDDIGVIFKNEGRSPRRPTLDLLEVYSRRNNVTPSLASRENEDWLTIRRAMNKKMLKADSAVKYLDVQNKVADDLVRRFKEKKFSPSEMRNEFFKYATESISALAFNKRMGYLDNDLEKCAEKRDSLENMKHLFELFNEALHTGTGFYKYFRTPFYKKYEKVANDVLSLTNSVLDECLTEMREQEKQGPLDNDNPTFLQAMLDTSDVTLDDIKTVIIDLFVAGTDSTAKTLQLILYILAKNPEKQRQLHSEIISLIGTSGPLTAEKLQEMHYLKACVKESFRFYNPISSICRFLPNEISLRDYRIPKDTLVIMCNHRTIKNEKYFHDAGKFLPERWLRNEDRQRSDCIHPMATLPFGVGPRSCVGRRFAEQEIYLAVTKIIQSFEVNLEPNHKEIDIEYTVFITTKDPIPFVFKTRE